MSASILPELRPYLEHLLDDALAEGGITVNNPLRRERMLSQLHKQFERFLLYQLLLALPSVPRHHFASLIELNVSDEELKDFIMRHLYDVPGFIQQVFADFPKRYLKPW